MPSKLACLKLHENSQESISEIKKGNRYKYLILNIKDEAFIHLTDFGTKDGGPVALLEKLRTDKCYFVLYNHNQPSNESVILIAWIPNSLQNYETDLYTRALMIVKTLVKIEHLLIVDNTVIDLQYLENSINKCLASAVNPNIIHVPAAKYPIDERGLGCLYFDCMQKNKEKTAQIIGLTGEAHTFGQLLQKSIRLAIHMDQMGIKHGDIVCICSNDGEDAPLAIIATLFLGATMSAVDPTFGSEDIINCLKQLLPKLIFVIPEALNKIETALREIGANCMIVVYTTTTETHTAFNDLIQPIANDDCFQPIPVNNLLETAFIVFTSGSTGMPKSICHNHISLQYQYMNFIHSQFCWDTVLHYSVPYWAIYAQFLGVSIILGTNRVVYRSFYEHYWHFLQYKITTIFFSVAEIATLCSYERPKHANFQDLKIIIVGNVMSQNHLEKIQNVFYDADLYVSYGLSEIPNGSTVFKANDEKHLELKRKYPTSVGTGVSGLSYKIVDGETEEIVGANKKGELRIKTQFPLGGYFKAQSWSLWDSYGWLKTGDVAYYNEDNCFYIVERVHYMFKYQDYHIIPSVIENVLHSHPAVHRACVIGLPNKKDSNHPLGVVILKPTYESVTCVMLEDYVEERVPDYQRLRAGVKFVEKFPTTPTGKICKRLLLQSFIGQN